MENKKTHKQVIEERRKRREEAERAQQKKKRTNIAIGCVGAVVLAVVLILLIMQPWSAKKSNHDMTVKHHIEIDVKDYGVIKAELDPTYAPITVDNFLTLAESGFYDGLTFHRIIEGFMIQGGDPEHNGYGSGPNTIKGEFNANGVNNPLSHKRGVISMARSEFMDSASCQFFIVQKDYPSLDGKYAAFGTVTEGMDIVDKIVEDAEPIDNNGTIPYENQPIITKITVID